MGAFLALLLTIIVFALLVHSHEGIKKEPIEEDNEKSEEQKN